MLRRDALARLGVPPRPARSAECSCHLHAVHLLSAVTGSGSGRVISQLPVPGKTTEVTALPALLAPFDLTGVTVTADALHTTRE
ncbi:hypothetical protein [Streptomyces sp. NPDC087270]|uniref:hypothetical protein n=1 Tax=Streptomyces sp. NPDC087270 TaxID=3365774 RepID=UPI00382B7026